MSATIVQTISSSSSGSSMLALSAVRRRLPQELHMIQEEIARSFPNTALACSVQAWHDDCQRELKDRKVDPAELIQTFQSALEKIVEGAWVTVSEDQIDPLALFLANRMGKEEALFYSERIKGIRERSALYGSLFQEFHGIEEALQRSNPNFRFVQAAEIWLKGAQASLKSKKHHPPGDVIKTYQEELENLLKDPESEVGEISLGVFTEGAEPVTKRIVERMTDPKSLLFSRAVDVASQKARDLFQRQALQERIERIHRLREETLQLEEAAFQRSSALADRVRQFCAQEADQLHELVTDSKNLFAVDHERIQSLRQRIDQRFEERRQRAEAAERRIEALNERIDRTKQEQADLDLRITNVETEHTQLRKEMTELHEAIEAKKDEFIKTIVIHVAIAAVTWGASEVAQGALEFSKGMIGLTKPI